MSRSIMLLAGIELIGTSSASGSGSGDGGSSRWRVVEPKASARDFGGDDGVANGFSASSIISVKRVRKGGL